MRRTTKGANWNVIGLTDLGGSLVERYVYGPYGELTVHQGERNQGGSVNAYSDYKTVRQSAKVRKSRQWAIQDSNL